MAYDSPSEQKASQSWCNFVLIFLLFINNSLDMHLHVISFDPTNNGTKDPITPFRLRSETNKWNKMK